MHTLAHLTHGAGDHHTGDHNNTRDTTRGWVMNLGWRYDAMVSLLDTLVFRGRLHGLLREAADLAHLQPGDRVLDVGCGTGQLALIAKERVGPAGHVAGIDPGPKQIARARARAARRRMPIDFHVGVIERLSFPDASFDVVLSTLMLHHPPDDVKRQGLAEVARVLAPGGRLVVVDFRRGEGRARRATFGAGKLGVQDLTAPLAEAGFKQLEMGELRMPRLPGVHGAGFALGRRPAARNAVTPPTAA